MIDSATKNLKKSTIFDKNGEDVSDSEHDNTFPSSFSNFFFNTKGKDIRPSLHPSKLKEIIEKEELRRKKKEAGELFLKNYAFDPNLTHQEVYKKHLKRLTKGANQALKISKFYGSTYKKEKFSLQTPQSSNKKLFFNFILLKGGKKTLFLDLDGTLIHACRLEEYPQYILNIDPSSNGNYLVIKSYYLKKIF